MIGFRLKGGFSKTERYLKKTAKLPSLSILEKYGKEGVAALASATPVDSGQTAGSWYYEIERSAESAVIRFNNSHINQNVPIAIILQYGHGTGTGGWVEGRDYINTATQIVFDRLVNEAWREVTNL